MTTPAAPRAGTAGIRVRAGREPREPQEPRTSTRPREPRARRVSGPAALGRVPHPSLPAGSRVLFTGAEIGAAVDRIAADVRAHYGDEELLVIAVLHGGLVFAADLIRRLDMPLRLGVVTTRSYAGGATTAGELKLMLEPTHDVAGRHVLLVDDILDTGRTLTFLRDHLAHRGELGPRSVRVATLLDKPSRRQVPIEADFRGLVIPDLFVVGYGLDWNERFRNLPDIVALPRL
jgi:hypoxanthine phosphoribosyltransferase